MDDTKKMLRAIINGQSSLKQELLGVISKLSTKVDILDNKSDKLDKKVDAVEKRLTKRIDKLGLQLAHLEDDAPTVDEFENLERRVSKVENKTATL